MIYHLALEDIEPDHWVAWVLDLPACYSSAKTMDEAVKQTPQKIDDYFSWLVHHDGSLSRPDLPYEVNVVETFFSFPSSDDPQYLVNAFFEDDRRPLGYWDIIVMQRLLAWSHQDLAEFLVGLDEDSLQQSFPQQVHGSISGILAHLGGAENWYFSHLDMGLAQLPTDPMQQIEAARQNTNARLWELLGDQRIIRHNSELWSARKVLRRTLWHESDHMQQIRQLLAKIRGGKNHVLARSNSQ